MTLEVGYQQMELRWVWTVAEGVAGVKNALIMLRTVGNSEVNSRIGRAPTEIDVWVFFPCRRMNLFHVPSQGKIRTHPSYSRLKSSLEEGGTGRGDKVEGLYFRSQSCQTWRDITLHT